MAGQMILTEDEIAAAYDEGRLFDMVFDGFRGADEEVVARIAEGAASLHNCGRIDLEAMLDEQALAGLEAGRFFSAHGVFDVLIPQLELAPAVMAALVDRLVEKGGADMAAGWPKQGFQRWCAADPARAAWVLRAAREGDVVATRMLDAALVADGRIDSALAFLRDGPPGARPIAINALGRLKVDEKHALRILEALDQDFMPEPDDVFDAQRIQVAVGLAKTHGSETHDRLASILTRGLANPGPLTLNAAAQALWLDLQALPPKNIETLLNALRHLDPSYGAVLHNLDHALATLLKGSHADRAVNFVSHYVAEHDLDVKWFDGVMHDLLTGPRARLDRVFVAWMIGETPALAQGLIEALRTSDMAGAPFGLALMPLALSPAEAERLAKRAVGFFFLKPVTAASILVSVLRDGPPEAAATASGLLFDPLLINYGGKTRDYLLALKANDPAQAAVSAALTQADRYLEILRSVGDIKELDPTETQILIKNRLDQEEMRQAHKAAEAQSVFKDIFTRSVVLHGRQVRTYMTDFNGQRQFTDITLQSHGFSVELPRTEIVDPVELEYRLRQLRIAEDAA